MLSIAFEVKIHWKIKDWSRNKYHKKKCNFIEGDQLAQITTKK